MSFESTFVALLSSGSPPPSDAGARVYPMPAPEAVEPPFVTYERMATEPVWTLNGQANLDAVYVELTVAARTLLEARAVADDLRAVLAADTTLKCVLEDDEVDFDFDRKLYLVIQTWRGWDKRS